MNEQEISKPAPSNDMQENLAQLRFQLNSALLVMVLLAGSFVFHLYHITSNAGKDVKSIPPQVIAAAANYQTNGLPRIQAFFGQLQEYGKTHPDFRPILIKHGLAQPAPAPAATAAPAPKK